MESGICSGLRLRGRGRLRERTLSVFASQIHLPRKGELAVNAVSRLRGFAPPWGIWQSRRRLGEFSSAASFPVCLLTFLRYSTTILNERFCPLCCNSIPAAFHHSKLPFCLPQVLRRTEEVKRRKRMKKGLIL